MGSHRHDRVSSMPSKPYSHKTPEQGLRKKRGCTDIPCCILFLIFIVCFAILSAFAFIEGNPKQLVHPTDSEGHLCGSGEFADRPYLYFFDWTQCIKALNVPSNLLQGRPFICPTTQVCVQQCPNRTSYHKFQNYPSNRICKYTVTADEQNTDELVKAGACASYVIASKPLFGRCVPEHLQKFVDSIVTATDSDGSVRPILDSNGQAVNGSKLQQGVKYLVDVLNLTEVAALLVEDFATSWPYILIGLGLAALISFIWIVLMRWLAKPIIWLGILLFILILAIATGLSFLEFMQLREKNDQQIFTEFKFVTDANYYRNLPITWLVIAIICALLLIVSLLVLIVLFKRLRIALAILTEASKAVGYNFFSLFWPFIPFLLQVGVFAYWTAVAVHLATAGKPIYRVTVSNLTDNETNMHYGENCDPLTWDSNQGLNGECVFWEYGYDPQVNLDSVLNGTGRHFKSFISFVNQNQWLPQLYSAFMLFWLTAFVIGFGQLVLAGVYARYYWDDDRAGFPCSTLCKSFFRALTFHLGTIAFGSLIIAIVKIIRTLLEYLQKKVEKKTGKIARCLFCCCRCCLFCLEKFLKFLNRNAYIMTAIYGTNFFTSARRAFRVIVSNPLRLLVIDRVCDFLIFIGKLAITGGIGVLAFFFFTHRIAGATDYVPELHYYLIPLLLIVIGTYVVATCFFSVYSMAVDTLFICALEDLRLKDKDREHELKMSKGLRKVFRVDKHGNSRASKKKM